MFLYRIRHLLWWSLFCVTVWIWLLVSWILLCFAFLQQPNSNSYIQEIKGHHVSSFTITRFTHFGITVWSSSNSICVEGCSPKYQRVASRHPSLSLCSARRGVTRRRLLGWSAAGLRVCAISASVAANEGVETVTFSPSLAKRRPSRSSRSINPPASHLAISSNSLTHQSVSSPIALVWSIPSPPNTSLLHNWWISLNACW